MINYSLLIINLYQYGAINLSIEKSQHAEKTQSKPQRADATSEADGEHDESDDEHDDGDVQHDLLRTGSQSVARALPLLEEGVQPDTDQDPADNLRGRVNPTVSSFALIRTFD